MEIKFRFGGRWYKAIDNGENLEAVVDEGGHLVRAFLMGVAKNFYCHGVKSKAFIVGIKARCDYHEKNRIDLQLVRTGPQKPIA
jgi:hypothetical protein